MTLNVSAKLANASFVNDASRKALELIESYKAAGRTVIATQIINEMSGDALQPELRAAKWDKIVAGNNIGVFFGQLSIDFLDRELDWESKKQLKAVIDQLRELLKDPVA